MEEKPETRPPPKKLTAPAKMLADIETHYKANIAPQVEKFMAHPPPKGQIRDFEYKQLSETILAQVLQKLDEVDVKGDWTIGANKNALVQSVQAKLKELDSVGKARGDLFGRDRPVSKMNEYWVNEEGINRDVIMREVTYMLGPDSTVRSCVYKVTSCRCDIDFSQTDLFPGNEWLPDSRCPAIYRSTLEMQIL